MMAPNNTGKDRDTWTTRSAFVLAAIGSAVGLGNLWAFPYKVYAYGGGAFLIPYFVAMLVMGIPLLIMEFTIGHWAQLGPPDAFAHILKKYRFVGWWLVSLAFVIITYYAVILGYCVDYLVVSIASFGSASLPWAGEGTGVAEDYFLKTMVGFDGSMKLGLPAWKIVAGSLASWSLIYLCLFRGVKWVSKVVLITVPLPWIMLAILTVRGLTLDGAIQGLEFYLEPRWSKLLEPDTWRFAFGQVFFSMSLGFAVMLSYASFLHRKSDINNNALIIGLGDMGTSFIAGIAVFAMLGGMSFAAKTPVPDLVPADSTVGLSFIVFPYGLTKLPAASFFSCVFFLALLTLGIDSAFSIVEACLTSVCDTKKEWPRNYVLPAICIIGATLGLVFTSSRGGLNWLGTADGLINGPFGILIVALAECVVVGWCWNGRFVREMRDHANERSDWKLYAWWDVVVKYIAPAFLSVLIVWSISGMVHKELAKYAAAKGNYNWPLPVIIGSILFILIPVVCWILCKRNSSAADVSQEKTGARRGIAYSLTIMVFAALMIEVAQKKKWLTPCEVQFAANGELNATAYVFLAVALLAIFGGLVWCFWAAIQAASRRDPQIDDSQTAS